MVQAPAAASVLLVEPDRDTREALADLLQLNGFDTAPSPSFAHAAELARERRYDVVLADVSQLHRVTDLNALQALREAVFPAPFGVMSTALADAPLEDTGPHAFRLSKPFEATALIAELARTLASHVALDPTREPARTLASYFACLGRSDWEGLAALCTEDVTYVLPGEGKHATEIHGREAFRDFSARTFAGFPDARFEQVETFHTPHGWVARYVGSWTGADGLRVALPGAVLFELRGNAIARIGIRLDNARLAHLGA